MVYEYVSLLIFNFPAGIGRFFESHDRGMAFVLGQSEIHLRHITFLAIFFARGYFGAIHTPADRVIGPAFSGFFLTAARVI